MLKRPQGNNNLLMCNKMFFPWQWTRQFIINLHDSSAAQSCTRRTYYRVHNSPAVGIDLRDVWSYVRAGGGALRVSRIQCQHGTLSGVPWTELSAVSQCRWLLAGSGKRGIWKFHLSTSQGCNKWTMANVDDDRIHPRWIRQPVGSSGRQNLVWHRREAHQRLHEDQRRLLRENEFQGGCSGDAVRADAAVGANHSVQRSSLPRLDCNASQTVSPHVCGDRYRTLLWRFGRERAEKHLEHWLPTHQHRLSLVSLKFHDGGIDGSLITYSALGTQRWCRVC